MIQKQTVFSVQTKPESFVNITNAVCDFVRQSGIKTGLLTVFMTHTSASLTVQENADPDVMLDLKDFFDRAVPQDNRLYRHTYEGKDDMPAHIRTSLTDVSVNIPVVKGLPAFGRWQALYVCEHRAEAHIRNIVLHLIGE